MLKKSAQLSVSVLLACFTITGQKRTYGSPETVALEVLETSGHTCPLSISESIGGCSVPRPAILCAMLVAATLSLVGCTQPPSLQSIQVIPNGASLTTIGETVQFKAIGTYQRGGNHPSTTTD